MTAINLSFTFTDINQMRDFLARLDYVPEAPERPAPALKVVPDAPKPEPAAQVDAPTPAKKKAAKPAEKPALPIATAAEVVAGSVPDHQPEPETLEVRRRRLSELTMKVATLNRAKAIELLAVFNAARAANIPDADVDNALLVMGEAVASLEVVK